MRIAGQHVSVELRFQGLAALLRDLSEALDPRCREPVGGRVQLDVDRFIQPRITRMTFNLIETLALIGQIGRRGGETFAHGAQIAQAQRGDATRQIEATR